jgi:hypothetical protein
MRCSSRRHRGRNLSGSCTASRWSPYGPGCGGCWGRTPAGSGSGSSSRRLPGEPGRASSCSPAGAAGRPACFRAVWPAAGRGYAFRAHEIVHRPSQDLDFATSDDTPLPEIAARVRDAFQRAGYGVRLAEAASPRYARLVLQLPGSGEKLEILRTLPAVMIPTSTWRRCWTISPGSAYSATRTSPNTGWLRTLPPMKPQMTHDQCASIPSADARQILHVHCWPGII